MDPLRFENMITYDYEINNKKISKNILIQPMVKSFYLHTHITKDILDGLNKYLDNLYNDEKSESYSAKLVGQIKSGKQLNINKEDPLIKLLIDEVMNFAKLYVNIFEKINGTGSVHPQMIDNSSEFNYIRKNHDSKLKLKKELRMDDIWSVHQKKHDYNPLHYHTNDKSLFGLSWFLHVNLPDKLDESNFEGLNGRNSDGLYDGTTNFIWDTNRPFDSENFVFSGTSKLIREAGHIYMFPQWLQHHVYPFDCEGERRTISGNIACIYNEIKE